MVACRAGAQGVALLGMSPAAPSDTTGVKTDGRDGTLYIVDNTGGKASSGIPLRTAGAFT